MTTDGRYWSATQPVYRSSDLAGFDDLDEHYTQPMQDSIFAGEIEGPLLGWLAFAGAAMAVIVIALLAAATPWSAW